MNLYNDTNFSKICNRLRYELRKNNISYSKAAKDLGVSWDLLCSYTSINRSEASMQVDVLKKFADYLGKDKYYFCNDYHKFIDTTDVGSFLMELRCKKKITQKEFASCLGISLASYKTYEEGKCKLPWKVYDKLKNEIGFT